MIMQERNREFCQIAGSLRTTQHTHSFQVLSDI